jgi:cold shock CspA family protein
LKKKGTVKYFYKTRDFGFIKIEEENKDIFFMGTDIKENKKLKTGDTVTFILEKHGKKQKATEVTKLE